MLALVLSLVMQTASISQAAEQAMLADINAIRQSVGLAPLVLDARLSRIAAAHTLDMARRHYFDHNTPGGRSPFDRMRAAFIRFSWAGENIALASSERRAFDALLKSPEHLRNMLQTHFTRVGIGVVRVEPGGDMIFVQDFTG